MLRRTSIVFLIIVMIALIAGACSSGGGSQQKKPPTQQQTGEQTPEGTQPPGGTPGAGETPSTTVNDEGSVSSSAGGMSVTNEQGVTKTYDAQGNEITSQADASQTAPGASQTNTGSSTATPEGAKQAIKTRGDVNINNKIAIIKTNFGDVYAFFYPEIAPTHVRNFIYLAEKGFYKDVPFHRIVKGFMAQAGIPRADWLEPVSSMPLEARLGSNAMHFPGTLSAARTKDPNSATSQFFLVFTRERAKHLDGQYTVFGQAFRGFDVLKKLESVKLGPNTEMGGGEVSKPLQDVHIVDVVIEDAGKYQEEINKIVTENSKTLEKERPQPSTPRPAGSG